MELTKYFGNTDLKASAEWLELSVGNDKLKLFIAPHNNVNYRHEAMKHQKSLTAEEPDMQLLMDLDNKCTAEFLLLDWENVIVNGKPLEYSVAAAEKVLSDYPDLAQIVKDKAMEMHEAQVESVKKIKKK